MRAAQDPIATPLTGSVPEGPLRTGAEPEATEDLLLEEVSIDGMCGVY
ncbi:mycofactocin precursor MftA [Arthrobacter sp. zg-Y238]|nr:mycofactocin precursor MftA [Arthrobacter sp. zg-Y238]MCQ1953552.1 mycofactocin precursor MftA [Arthrobacter sp. zg-Y238]